MFTNKQKQVEELRLEDGYGLNYDKLKALSIRLQKLHEINMGQLSGFVTTKGLESSSQNTFTTMTVREINVQQSHGGNEDDVNQTSPAKQTADNVANTGRQENLSELDLLSENQIAPKKLTKGHCPCPDAAYWQKLYIGVLKEYEGFKAQSEFILESNLNASEQRVSVLMEETEKTRQTLEKEKFSLTSTCRDLNRGKIALECEIRTLRDELEETRRKLVCAEEKVTKECDFHQRTRKIDERNFKTGEWDCENKMHRTLQSTLTVVQRKNQYLEDEVMEANRRNDQLTDEIKTIFSGHDAQVKDLKNLMNVYETQLQEERREFEIKLAETQGVLEIQEKYMKKADAFIREREESQKVSMEKLNNYSAGLLEESNKTMMLLEQKLEKAQAQRKDLTTSLSKAVQVIQKLKEQPKRCHNVVLDYCSEIYTIFSIIPQRSSSRFKLDIFEDNATRFLEQRDSPKNCDEETAFEVILENMQKFLKDLLHELEFWKKENDGEKNQLKGRMIELESHMSGDKKNLLMELNSTREKCLKYKRSIKNMTQNIGKYQIKKNPQRRCVSFMETSPKSPRGSGKEVRQRPNSSSRYILHTQDITQLQKRHAKFSEILEHVDKYVSHSEGPDYQKEKRTIRSEHPLLD